MSQLFDAVRTGDLERCHALLAAGAPVNGREVEGESTPLHAAAYGQYPEIVRLLIAKGAGVNARDSAEQSPLLRAVRCSDDHALAIASLLVEHGADVNAGDNEGETPLMAAAKHEDAAVLRLLLAHGADLHRRDHDGATALSKAAFWGAVAAVEVLLSGGAEPNECDESGWTPLHGAAYAGSRHTARLLLEAGAEVDARDEDGHTALYYAAREDNSDLSTLLLDHGAEVVHDDSPLHLAVMLGSFEQLRKLIAGGADLNARHTAGATPVEVAIRLGRRDMVELMLDCGAPVAPGQSGASPTLLHLAARSEQAEIVELLLSRGLDVNATDQAGSTALHYAAQASGGEKGDLLDTVRVLMAAGAVIDAANRHGETPLHQAFAAFDVQRLPEHVFEATTPRLRAMVELLLSHGADPNARPVGDRRGWGKRTDALRCAVEWGDPGVVRLLMEAGADPQVRDRLGLTSIGRASRLLAAAGRHRDLPRIQRHSEVLLCLLRNSEPNAAHELCQQTDLLEAAAVGDVPRVEALLAGGAVVNATDRWGATPLHWAAQGNYVEVVRALLAHGATANTLDSSGCTPYARPGGGRLRAKAVTALLLQEHLIGAIHDTLRLSAESVPFLRAEAPLELHGTSWLMPSRRQSEAERAGSGRLANPELPFLELLLDLSSDQGEGWRATYWGLTLRNRCRVYLEDAHEEWPCRLRALAAVELLDDAADVARCDRRFLNLLLSTNGAAFGHYLLPRSHDNPTEPADYLESGAEYVLGPHADLFHSCFQAGEPAPVFLRVAVAAGDVERTAALLASGADINARNERRETPLHLAGTFNRQDVARLLLEHGADVGAVDYLNQTPLETALDRGHRDMVELLMAKATIEPQPQSDAGNPALQGAASGECYEGLIAGWK